ncbi:Bug family tripartite tricarboxylate transporter substrate binding protein [Polaromonas sp. UC242_47]|uniref:Bug family tripartite tricarboxylate transporter substrate binding protein n=1 Tax=Polaromonas sp. UC242_47 TaxID=3374626 RepID=UPI0037A23F91
MTQPLLKILAMTALLLTSSVQVHAQAFPAKPVRIVVGFAAGGSTDKLARVLALRMGELLGQPVLVDNRPGAAGNIAAEGVAAAAPDGYTVFMATLSSQAINPHLYAKLKFDPIKSFEPIGLVAKYPLLLVVPPQLKLNSVQDLISYARANPGQTFFASSGNGSPAHLAGEIFKTATGTDVRHVPYRGGGPAMLALMSNEAQFGFETIPSAIGHTRGGKLNGLAVTSDQRSAAAPNLPTMQEAGLKGFSVTSWAGLLVPAGTPRDVVTKLAETTRAAIASPGVKAALANDGAEPGGGSPADFASFMNEELKTWGAVVRAAGAKVD